MGVNSCQMRVSQRYLERYLEGLTSSTPEGLQLGLVPVKQSDYRSVFGQHLMHLATMVGRLTLSILSNVIVVRNVDASEILLWGAVIDTGVFLEIKEIGRGLPEITLRVGGKAT